MKFEFLYKDKTRGFAENVLSYQLTENENIPCNGLRLTFCPKGKQKEIVSVWAYSNNKIVFFGYADLQKDSFLPSGKTSFLYARSSASLLVDNEALPQEMQYPTLAGLAECFSSEFGFKNMLPKQVINSKYTIQKGTSLFGAINYGAQQCLNKNIYVTANNELKCRDKSDDCFAISNSSIAGITTITSRAKPISEYIFKRLAGDRYIYHIKAKNADFGIKRKKYINLSSYPSGQIDFEASKRIKSTYTELYTAKVELFGIFDLPILSRICLEKSDFDFRNYVIMEKTIIKDNNQEKTVLILRKDENISEVTYVD